MILPDRWIDLSNKRGDSYRVNINELETLETKYREFVEQPPQPGMTWSKDFMLELKLVDGNALYIAASSIGEFMEISQEGLTNHYEMQAQVHKLHKSVDPES